MPTSLDILNQVKIVNCLSPIVKTSDTNCTSVDVKGWSSLFFIVYYGITADTLSGSVYVACHVEGSTDDSTFVDLGATYLYSRAGTSSSNEFGKIDDNSEDDAFYVAGVKLDAASSYRYYRVVVDFTGTHTYGIEVAVLGILGGGKVPDSTVGLNP